MTEADLVADYGVWVYPAIFLWTFLEGETFVLFAGFAAHQGHLDWNWVFLTAWIGSFCGDQTYFWVGRRWGSRLLDRVPRWRPRVDRALEWLNRYNTGFILSFRFIYGVRNFASFAMGMSEVNALRFAALNFLAAFIWALSFAGFGYLFGHVLEAMLGDVARGLGVLALVAFVVFVLRSLGLAWRRRRERAAANRATPS